MWRPSLSGPFLPRRRGRPHSTKANVSPLMIQSATGARDVIFVTLAGCAGEVTRLRTVSPKGAAPRGLGPDRGMPEEMRRKAPSPIVLSSLELWLGRYPDRESARFLWEGFSFGFRLPISQSIVVASPRNLKSAREFPMVVRQKVEAEVGLGCMCGPFATLPLPDLCISPIGVVPKKVPGKYRLIQHLSFPHGGSVNDGIPDSMCRVRYQLFDEALGLVRSFGPGSLMAKLMLSRLSAFFRFTRIRFVLWVFVLMVGSMWIVACLWAALSLVPTLRNSACSCIGAYANMLGNEGLHIIWTTFSLWVLGTAWSVAICCLRHRPFFVPWGFQ